MGGDCRLQFVEHESGGHVALAGERAADVEQLSDHAGCGPSCAIFQRLDQDGVGFAEPERHCEGFGFLGHDRFFLRRSRCWRLIAPL